MDNLNLEFLNSIKVLYVEDEVDIRDELSEMLEFDIPNLYIAKNGQEGFEKFKELKPDIIVTDIRMPIMDGLTMIERIKEIEPNIDVVITTAFSDTSYLMRAIEVGVDNYITKPIDYEKLIDTISKIALNIYRAKELELKSKFISFILDSHPSFVLTTRAKEIEFLNQTFLNFLGFNSLEEFLKSSKLGDFITQIDDVGFQKESDWFEMLTKSKDESIIYFKVPNTEYTNRAFAVIKRYFKDLDRTLFSFVDISKFQSEKERFRDKASKAEEKNRNYLKMLEIQSRQALMGEMIDSIAHQWKQPLNIISLYAFDITSALESGELDEDYADDLTNKIIMQVQHMGSTLEEFRGFFRPNKVKKSFKLIDSIESVILLVRDEFNKNSIDIEVDCDSKLVAYGFVNELKHVILNIINNSKDAFKEKNIKERKIRVRAIEGVEFNSIFISDNAGGIDEQILPHIFKANFTTKSEGKGTGIGLYMSKMMIVENMQGEIDVANIENGVEFLIKLPKSLEEDIDESS